MSKKIICFAFLLIPWFVSSILFPFDAGFYNSLNLPSITPPKFIFIIIWPILFTLITITVYRILKKESAGLHGKNIGHRRSGLYRLTHCS